MRRLDDARKELYAWLHDLEVLRPHQMTQGGEAFERAFAVAREKALGAARDYVEAVGALP